MDSETMKGKPLTKEETKFLLDLIEGSQIITTKSTNATNNKLKNEEWIRLAEKFNATATNWLRKPQQLRLKWFKFLKKNARKRSTAIRMNQIKTGGGPAEYIPPDEVLDRVTALLGSTVSGFTVPFGGDKEIIFTDGAGSGVGEGGSSDLGVSSGVISVINNDSLLKENVIFVDTDIETIITDNKTMKTTSHLNLITTPNKFKRLTFNTPRTGRKKLKTDESRSTRNQAIADYYIAKKNVIDDKLINIKLEKENLTLRNLELKLNNDKLILEKEKLALEKEKLALELEKLRQRH